jgi:hypothetical protein
MISSSRPARERVILDLIEDRLVQAVQHVVGLKVTTPDSVHNLIVAELNRLANEGKLVGYAADKPVVELAKPLRKVTTLPTELRPGDPWFWCASDGVEAYRGLVVSADGRGSGWVFSDGEHAAVVTFSCGVRLSPATDSLTIEIRIDS